MSRIRADALAAHDAGLSILPIKSDGTKAPPFPWGKYQHTRPAREQVVAWFDGEACTGFAAVCGPVSNNLECLDFDDAQTYQVFIDTGESLGLRPLLDRIRAGCEDETPAGGAHLPYYCESVGRNTVLAADPGPDPARPKEGQSPLIETRAGGGYVVMAPSNGKVHPSGRAWRRVSGSVETIATITPNERELLFALARSLDRMPAVEEERQHASSSVSGGMDRPGDDFRRRHGTLDAFRSIVEPHGWKLVLQRGDVGYFRRPDKAEGWSATFGHRGGDWFWVFSSSTPFDPERGYNPFSVYAILEHGGDIKAAARELGRLGYGEQRQKLTGSAWSGGPDGAATGSGDDGRSDRQRPELDAGDADLARSSKAAWAALKVANDPPTVFLLAHDPVRVESSEGDAAPIARSLDVHRLGNVLADAASWFRKTGGPTAGTKPASPPLRMIHNMLVDPPERMPLPQLRSITRLPVFAPDGTLETSLGYHPASKTYYAPTRGFVLPEIATAPTVADVDAAKHLLLTEMLGDFPFVGQCERANAVALFLDFFVRPMIEGPTPLRLIEAPSAGTGKGRIVDAIGIAALGSSPPVMTAPGDPEEWRKTISTQLREAPAMVLIDNIVKPLYSGFLAAALTAPHWKDRRLGSNENIYVPVHCLWVATANNPVMSTEIARRTVRIRLDAKVDQPWLRSGFRHEDLCGWVAANRLALVGAGITLVRHWLAQGRPLGSIRLGSFERWSQTLGGILGACGIDGFLGNLMDFYESADAEGALWRQFVAIWAEKLGETETGVAELFEVALSVDGFDVGNGSERSQRTSFGKQIGKQRDRVIGDYRILQTRTVNRAKRWRLAHISHIAPPEAYEHHEHQGTFFDTPCEKSAEAEAGAKKTEREKTFIDVHNVHTDGDYEEVTA